MVAAIALTLLWAAAAIAQPVSGQTYEPATATDPRVPLDELALLLLPLEKEELEAEAAAWVALVKAKVHALTDAEIAAKYKRLEIARSNEVAQAARTAQGAVEEAEDAAASGETVAETLEQAAAAAAEARAALDAAAEAEKKVDEDAGVREVTEEAAAVVASEVSSVADDARTDSAAIDTGLGAVDSDDLEEVAEAADEAAKAKSEVREAIFERVSELRNERLELLERAHLVLDSLKAKGGEIDNSRKYLDAVGGVQIDVTDTSATWAAAVGWLKASQGGVRLLRNVLRFVLVVIASWIVALGASKIADKAMQHSSSVSSLTRVFVSKMLRRLILAAGFITGLATLEIDVGPMLAIVGGVTFVLAFALQDSLGNLASGLMIMIFRPFDIGHVVSVAGARGRVDSMNLVSTTIKTPDNQTVVVPNRKIWGDVITNITGSERRRVDLVFRVGHDADLDTALGILERAVAAHPLVLEEPAPETAMAAIEESGISLVCRPWTKTEDLDRVRSELTRTVREEFRNARMPLPIPMWLQRAEA